ncbi:hypothetical protein HHI36_007584, partial [Cryptolaemus montrouzieri]
RMYRISVAELGAQLNSEVFPYLSHIFILLSIISTFENEEEFLCYCNTTSSPDSVDTVGIINDHYRN